MVSNTYNRWIVAGTTFGLWGLVAASTVYWGLKLSGRPGAAVPANTAARAPLAADPMAVSRLLGANPGTVAAAPTVNAASRFVLVGVAASASHSGAALISVDGKPAKPFRVGSAVDEGLVLQSVEDRRAFLGAAAGGQPAITLELPPRPRLPAGARAPDVRPVTPPTSNNLD